MSVRVRRGGDWGLFVLTALFDHVQRAVHNVVKFEASVGHKSLNKQWTVLCVASNVSKYRPIQIKL